MKYLKTKKIYQASNVTFDAEKCEARSYKWWVFVAKIRGRVVFNNFQYSNSTTRHQYKVRSLLEDLGIKIDLEIKAPDGLQHLDGAYKHYERLISDLEKELQNPKNKPHKNAERRKTIEEYHEKMRELECLGVQVLDAA